MQKQRSLKKMIFVSSGRCGTKRLYEILRDALPDDFAVVHQMNFSRLANVVGNLMYYLGYEEHLCRMLYRGITSKYDVAPYFISTDPLTAMIIPESDIRSRLVCIVHVIRDDEKFAPSMYALSRSRIKSFIAHNFVPIWQPGIWPFENLLNKNILKKYAKVNSLKNVFFENRYGSNPNYLKIGMQEIFLPSRLEDLIRTFFSYPISVSETDLRKKSNESKS